MASTTENMFVDKEPKKVKGCKPSHKEQREAIGAGHLVCSSCEIEIEN